MTAIAPRLSDSTKGPDPQAAAGRTRLFESLLAAERLVQNKEVLRTSYGPSILPHRQDQINQIAQLLVCALEGQRASNVLVHGPKGAGKTSVLRHVGDELQRTGQEKDRAVFFIYINCELVDTQYRVLTHIANHFIEDWN